MDVECRDPRHEKDVLKLGKTKAEKKSGERERGTEDEEGSWGSFQARL